MLKWRSRLTRDVINGNQREVHTDEFHILTEASIPKLLVGWYSIVAGGSTYRLVIEPRSVLRKKCNGALQVIRSRREISLKLDLP
jgi:hypothetical protein